MSFVKKFFGNRGPEQNPEPRRDFLQRCIDQAVFSHEMNYGDWITSIEQATHDMPAHEGRAFWSDLRKSNAERIQEASDIVYALVAGFDMPEHLEVSSEQALNFAKRLILEATAGDIEIHRAAGIHHIAPASHDNPDAYMLAQALFARMMNGAQLYKSRGGEMNAGAGGRG